MIARLRDGSEVAAWLLKANPEVWDVVGALRGGESIESWRLVASYRVDLLSAGQPCVLWVTGARDARPTPGVWAVGTLTGVVDWDCGDPADHRWRDEGARRQVRPRIGVELTVLDAVLSRSELRDDVRFASAEVLRRPRMGNPVALGPQAWAAICDRLDEAVWSSAG